MKIVESTQEANEPGLTQPKLFRLVRATSDFMALSKENPDYPDKYEDEAGLLFTVLLKSLMIIAYVDNEEETRKLFLRLMSGRSILKDEDLLDKELLDFMEKIEFRNL